MHQCISASVFFFFSSVEIYGENKNDVNKFSEDYLGYIDCNTTARDIVRASVLENPSVMLCDTERAGLYNRKVLARLWSNNVLRRFQSNCTVYQKGRSRRGYCIKKRRKSIILLYLCCRCGNCGAIPFVKKEKTEVL